MRLKNLYFYKENMKSLENSYSIARNSFENVPRQVDIFIL